MSLTVYLSSTLKDLEEERAAVKAALGDKCLVKESYSASETALVPSCLEDVAACDLYVLILGLRYGYVPKSEIDNPQGLSITEIEYNQANDKRRPRFVFIKVPDEIKASMTDGVTGDAVVCRARPGRHAVIAHHDELSEDSADALLNGRRQRRERLLGLPVDHARQPAEALVVGRRQSPAAISCLVQFVQRKREQRESARARDGLFYETIDQAGIERESGPLCRARDHVLEGTLAWHRDRNRRTVVAQEVGQPRFRLDAPVIEVRPVSR